jgi:hypothetical protein
VKKIGLITIHRANSYGGVLQALATQEVLSKYGNVRIIDYSTTHLKKTMQLIRFGFKPRDFLRIGKDIFRLIPRYKLLNKFNHFFNKFYNLTPKCSHQSDLIKLNQEFDIFVCGSDQIWNPNIIDDFDFNYFLKFVNKGNSRVAYASSMGSYIFSEKQEKKMIHELKKFKSIAVREMNPLCKVLYS